MAGSASAVQDAIAQQIDGLVLDFEAAERRLQRLVPGLREMVATPQREPADVLPEDAELRISVATLHVEKADVDRLLALQDQIAALPGITDITLYSMEGDTVSIQLDLASGTGTTGEG